MKPLATSFRSHGYDFKQLDRVGMVALFEKTHKDVPGRSFYEVVVVQAHSERVIAGNTIAAAEAMPGAEQFGRLGWSYSVVDGALVRFEEQLKKQGAVASERPMTLADLAEMEES